MAHFAELNNNDVVLRVIVVSNSDTMHNGVEDEATGIAFCKKLFGTNTKWAQTSYYNNFRVRYAGIGYSFDRQRDAFIPPKPYPSWLLDSSICDWYAPVPYPNDGARYVWNEATLSWIKIT